MADTNKVKFGLKNCYYSILTETNGAITYGEVKPLPGAVNLNVSPSGGDSEPFYADDIVYYMVPGTNNGYEGTLELAKVPDAFHIDVLGAIVDANGMLVENAEAVSKEFALMFEFKGDKMATRHVLYRCTATRGDVAGQTIEETATPQTETINLTAIPVKFETEIQGGTTVSHMVVKAKANGTDSGAQYNSWFTAVQTPTFTAEA